MWVFGYGSLMWGLWYKDFEGDDPIKARLVGFRRRFNKGSVRNWGSKETPGPTLNIEVAEQSSCVGMAFRFSEQVRQKILDYLQEREGKAFKLEEHPIVLESNKKSTAIVPIYHGINVLNVPSDKLVELALQATGTSGSCVDYVMNIERELTKHGIFDQEVMSFVALVRQRQ